MITLCCRLCSCSQYLLFPSSSHSIRRPQQCALRCEGFAHKLPVLL
jgi:hypothetical protein